MCVCAIKQSNGKREPTKARELKKKKANVQLLLVWFYLHETDVPHAVHTNFIRSAALKRKPKKHD